MSPRFTLTANGGTLARDVSPVDFIAALTSAYNTRRKPGTCLTVEMDGIPIALIACERRSPNSPVVWRTEPVKAGA